MKKICQFILIVTKNEYSDNDWEYTIYKMEDHI